MVGRPLFLIRELFAPIALAATLGGCVAGDIAWERLKGSVTPGLNYSSGSSVTYTVGTAISDAAPFYVGADFTAVGYTVAPALPSGLGMDPVSGVISGTPSTQQSSVTYLITATDAEGASLEYSLAITVNPQAPTSVNYSFPSPGP